MSEQAVPEWTLDGTLDELARIDRCMKDRQFAFILGAGASFTSGIPTGHHLAQQWLKDLHLRECGEALPLEDWLPTCGIGGGQLTLDNAAQHYPHIFERRFEGDREGGYAELETQMEGKAPSLGYSLLAEIIQNTRHKVVVTTNFDNLVADALAMHAHQSPLVVAHESLAGFVRPQLRRPLVAKIHRDLFLNPLNDANGVSTLEEGWKLALKKLFQYFTPVVVGYGGNDGSLMNMLRDLNTGEIAGRMVWCYRDGAPPNAIALEVLRKHKGLQVKIPGFDEFMLLLAAKLLKGFDVAEIAERTAKLGQERAERYRGQAKQLVEASARGTPDERKAGNVLTLSASAGNSWWAWELKAKAEPDLVKRDSLYREGIRLFPNSAELAGNYALFLENQRKDYDAAEALYKRALELDPSNANNTGNYAIFLKDQRKDYDAAEALFKKALELDPNHANNTVNYAIFLANQRKDDNAAEVLYKKALELDPNHANNAASYAILLANQRKDHDAAEALYNKALELRPDDANTHANLASLLLSRFESEDVATASQHVRHCLELARPQVSQASAEALMYGALIAELQPGADSADMLRRLKGALFDGFERGSWDFTLVFDAVLPHLPEPRRAFYLALGRAILDADQVAALDAFEPWRSLQPLDPFADLPSP
ncbi:tetratricopeptide repeat protein [Ideonella sp. 4Y11]|uniref:Tetratricopeptide repeat protein n=1 Tax=Ideonella aquatica TaxID=2824119 RepID=A0A940YF60_9BURK|nr:tetratricopeptide repeat protein [Ideonella aquatica]MBQ0959030.1 tetratricopeptide repeat protein [Ideonella aquatica]